MPAYSQGSSLLKGAIVAIDSTASGRRTIVFQYNPKTVKRSQALRYTGAPVKMIYLEVTINAMD